MRDREEINSFYLALKAAGVDGNGYGVDELPNIGFFVRWYIQDHYNLVFELAPSPSSPSPRHELADDGDTARHSPGGIIAYANIGTSLYSRSVNNSKICDGNIVVLPEFRGRRWSGELLELRSMICYDVGLPVVISDTLMNNKPILLNANRFGVTLTGTIPRGAYLKDVGWIDTVVNYKVETESFKKKQQKRAKSSPGQFESKP